MRKYIILPVVAARAATTRGSCKIYSKLKNPTHTAQNQE